LVVLFEIDEKCKFTPLKGSPTEKQRKLIFIEDKLDIINQSAKCEDIANLPCIKDQSQQCIFIYLLLSIIQ